VVFPYGKSSEPFDIAEWFQQYSRNDTVQGWVDPHFFNILAVIGDALNAVHVPGGILEIGVYHGKFFLAANALVDDPTAKSVAVDVFDRQNLNIDGSGQGDLSIFKNNLKMFDRHAGQNVIVMTADSTVLHPDELLAKSGQPFKIVSIDGGHTAEHTISDLELANAVVHPYGFVLVDDILNHHWMGVIDGVTTYLRRRPTLWPLAVGSNKLVMCGMSMFAAHQKFLREHYSFSKTTYLCGYEILAE
jgi:hypothetical protein